MKSIIYRITIILVVVSVSSCSKKNNDNAQQPQTGQEQSSVAQEKDPNVNTQEPSSVDTPVNEQVPPLKVVAVPNQDKLTLSNDKILEILKKAGFTDAQIQDCSASISDGLAQAGAVRITINDAVEAGIAIRGNDIYISTRSKGYFIYNIKTGWRNMQNQ